jgi:hypothetical protein
MSGFPLTTILVFAMESVNSTLIFLCLSFNSARYEGFLCGYEDMCLCNDVAEKEP